MALGSCAGQKGRVVADHGASLPENGSVERGNAARQACQQPGQAIYEPFMGSGTTLITAETTGRVCLGLISSMSMSR